MAFHDSPQLLAAFDWDMVVVALITAVASCVNTALGVVMWKLLRTPSGTSIGDQVESAHHTAIANNYRLQELAIKLGPRGNPEASAEESRFRPPGMRD